MKPIFTSLAPNTESDDVRLATKIMAQPWRWISGGAAPELENKFRAWLPARHAISFSSGRSALYAILKTLGLQAGDEVLLQAYTCVAVPNSVIWTGAKPIYVDCEEDTFNMSPADLKEKITPQSRALIIQHTFGLPAKLDELLDIAKKHRLFVIEDCAHALGSVYHGQNVGTFGNASFFSFGRDKVISSVFGGMAATNNAEFAIKLGKIRASWEYPSIFWIQQQLSHPIALSNAKATYGLLGLGKLTLAGSKQLHLISKAVYGTEKRGGKPSFVERKMPNALALLAVHQFGKLEKFNEHRKGIAKLYTAKLHNIGASPALRSGRGPAPILQLPSDNSDHIYLRYTIRTVKARELLQAAKREKIFLGDWYRQPIAPEGVNYNAIRYTPGACPTAEKLASASVNLPTDIHITDSAVGRIVELVKTIISSPD